MSLEESASDHLAETKRATLKKLSNDRQSQWPNTLEAQRRKREAEFKNREVLAEQKRRVLDQEEAELRRQQRLEAISRANDLLYEQTDCMKVLRSKELLADCLHDRKFQIMHKNKVKEDIKVENQKYHEVIMEAVRLGEEKEKAKKAEDERRMHEVALVREEQLRTVRAMRAAAAEEQRQIGLQMKRMAEERAEEDRKQQEEKVRVTKEKNKEFILGNEQLKEVRKQLKAQEQRDQEKRNSEVDVIENRKLVRKALEIRKFEKAQQTRLKMIERATELLAQRTNNDNALLEKQVTEQRAKEDKKFADKEQAREDEWKKTIESRNLQVEARRKAREDEAEAERQMIERWHIKSAADNAAEEAKIRKRHAMAMELRALQEAQANERKREMEEAKLIEDARLKMLIDQGVDEDKRFQEICKKEIQRYAADGKPTYPLFRALEYKQPDLLPVSGFRI
jgi:hypothetical protein